MNVWNRCANSDCVRRLISAACERNQATSAFSTCRMQRRLKALGDFEADDLAVDEFMSRILKFDQQFVTGLCVANIRVACASDTSAANCDRCFSRVI